MAYGLQIDNGFGLRVVDSEYNGIHYVGKASLSGSGIVQIPGYTNPDVPPMVFVKYPSSGFASVTGLSFESPLGGVGGVGSLTISTPSNTVYALSSGYDAGQSQGGVSESRCLIEGGQFIDTSIGGCRRIDDLGITIDKGSVSKSGLANLSFTTNGVINGVSVGASGFGWSVDDSASLHLATEVLNDGGRTEPDTFGWYPWNTAAQNWVGNPGPNGSFSSADTAYTPIVTVTSLANGWTTTISGSFTETVTVYYYGVGGMDPSSNSYGLALYNSIGETTFSSEAPPPVIRGVHNISFSGINHSISDVNSSSPSGLSYPRATTAMFAPPLMPISTWDGSFPGGTFSCQALGFGNFSLTTNESGIRFNSSGTVTGLVKSSAQNTTTSDQAGVGENIPWSVKSPLWSITSGTINATAQSGSVCNSGTVTPSVSWNVNTDCTFIDTTIPDGLSY